MELPVACSLAAGAQAERRERWVRLIERALAAREATDDGVRLGFRGLPGVAAELTDLLAGERECCAFAQWVNGPTLTVSSAGEGVPAVREMFGAPR
jgi:hypothetical protein